MLDFDLLTVANFPFFEADILRSEQLFPPDLRETSEDYQVALASSQALGLVARQGRVYVGNAVGFAPCPEQRTQLRLEHLRSSENELIYLFNIVTLPDFQNRGYGRQLLTEFCLQARLTGFRKVGGHFRGNGSLKNFTILGGRALATCPDWFATGECFTYCELDLSMPPKSAPAIGPAC